MGIDKQAYKEVAVVLAELMERERLTGVKLAKLAGVSHTTPWAILNGRANPSAEMLLRLARGLATSNSGQLDQEKLAHYAGELLRPLGFAPVIVDGQVTDQTAASVRRLD